MKNRSAVLIGPFGRATANYGTRTVVTHAHAEVNLLLKLSGADLHFHVGDDDAPLSDAQMLVIRPWEAHRSVRHSDEPTLILSLLIEPAWLSQQMAPGRAGERTRPAHRSVAVTPAIAERARRLVQHITEPEARASGDFERLLPEFIDAIERAGTDAAAARPPGVRSVDVRIRRALRLLDERAADNPKLQHIAAEVGLSRSHFFAQFKSVVGVSPQHYLDWARMRLAVGMLAGSDKPVCDVAAELGYIEPSHFGRFFAQHVAIPPSEFRRSIVDSGRAGRR